MASQEVFPSREERRFPRKSREKSEKNIIVLPFRVEKRRRKTGEVSGSGRVSR